MLYLGFSSLKCLVIIERKKTETFYCKKPPEVGWQRAVICKTKAERSKMSSDKPQTDNKQTTSIPGYTQVAHKNVKTY